MTGAAGCKASRYLTGVSDRVVGLFQYSGAGGGVHVVKRKGYNRMRAACAMHVQCNANGLLTRIL